MTGPIHVLKHDSLPNLNPWFLSGIRYHLLSAADVSIRKLLLEGKIIVFWKYLYFLSCCSCTVPTTFCTLLLGIFCSSLMFHSIACYILRSITSICVLCMLCVQFFICGVSWAEMSKLDWAIQNNYCIFLHVLLPALL